MFELLDSVFDLAANEGEDLTFNHPAYGMLRSTMNGFIRFAERLGIVARDLRPPGRRHEFDGAFGCGEV